MIRGCKLVEDTPRFAECVCLFQVRMVRSTSADRRGYYWTYVIFFMASDAVVAYCRHVDCMLDSVTPINSGWWREFNARDVAQLPLWVCSTADGGSVQLFADVCEQLNLSVNGTLHPSYDGLLVRGV